LIGDRSAERLTVIHAPAGPAFAVLQPGDATVNEQRNPHSTTNRTPVRIHLPSLRCALLSELREAA